MQIINIFILSFLFIPIINVSAQSGGEFNNGASCEAHLDSLIHREVYTISEEMPQPEGGMNNLYTQMAQKIHFPYGKLERIGVELDKIFIGFIVDVDGSVIGERIIRNIDGVDVVDQMFSVISGLTWKPGSCNKRPVPVLLIIPFQICLR